MSRPKRQPPRDALPASTSTLPPHYSYVDRFRAAATFAAFESMKPRPKSPEWHHADKKLRDRCSQEAKAKGAKVDRADVYDIVREGVLRHADSIAAELDGLQESDPQEATRRRSDEEQKRTTRQQTWKAQQMKRGTEAAERMRRHRATALAMVQSAPTAALPSLAAIALDPLQPLHVVASPASTPCTQSTAAPIKRGQGEHETQEAYPKRARVEPAAESLTAEMDTSAIPTPEPAETAIAALPSSSSSCSAAPTSPPIAEVCETPLQANDDWTAIHYLNLDEPPARPLRPQAILTATSFPVPDDGDPCNPYLPAGVDLREPMDERVELLLTAMEAKPYPRSIAFSPEEQFSNFGSLLAALELYEADDEKKVDLLRRHLEQRQTDDGFALSMMVDE